MEHEKNTTKNLGPEGDHLNLGRTGNHSPDMSLATRAYMEKYGIIENKETGHEGDQEIGNVLNDSLEQM